jgi:hypothetical protein
MARPAQPQKAQGLAAVLIQLVVNSTREGTRPGHSECAPSLGSVSVSRRRYISMISEDPTKAGDSRPRSNISSWLRTISLNPRTPRSTANSLRRCCSAMPNPKPCHSGTIMKTNQELLHQVGPGGSAKMRRSWGPAPIFSTHRRISPTNLADESRRDPWPKCCRHKFSDAQPRARRLSNIEITTEDGSPYVTWLFA